MSEFVEQDALKNVVVNGIDVAPLVNPQSPLASR